MTGRRLWLVSQVGDAVEAGSLLSTQGAHSCINYQDVNGSTPLHNTTREGHETVTAQLIAARCNVDLQDKNGYTPLHNATREGHADVTEQLIADVC
jgi:ankyrin repeat protein